ncbi:hypothetical protein [Clostridium sp.]|uniref:hypothetical protein n=1 Tax=Clostridium sp. TaxID=1506 RepID=UPI003F3953BC
MDIIQLQLLIILTIAICSLLGGKKGSLMASGVWFITSLIMMRSSMFSVFQLVTVAISFQLGLLIGFIRDYIYKRVVRKNEA